MQGRQWVLPESASVVAVSSRPLLLPAYPRAVTRRNGSRRTTGVLFRRLHWGKPDQVADEGESLLVRPELSGEADDFLTTDSSWPGTRSWFEPWPSARSAVPLLPPATAG